MSGAIYAPDYLRSQTDEQMHGIADMLEANIKKVQQLEKQLRFAAGLISTMDQFSNKHPEEVLKWIAETAKECPPHQWSRDGERCEICGTKDWMT